MISHSARPWSLKIKVKRFIRILFSPLMLLFPIYEWSLGFGNMLSLSYFTVDFPFEPKAMSNAYNSTPEARLSDFFTAHRWLCLGLVAELVYFKGAATRLGGKTLIRKRLHIFVEMGEYLLRCVNKRFHFRKGSSPFLHIPCFLHILRFFADGIGDSLVPNNSDHW